MPCDRLVHGHVWNTPLGTLGSTHFLFGQSGEQKPDRILRGLSYLPQMAQNLDVVTRSAELVSVLASRQCGGLCCLLLSQRAAARRRGAGPGPKHPVPQLAGWAQTAGLPASWKGKRRPLRERTSSALVTHHLIPHFLPNHSPGTSQADFSGFSPWSLTFHHHLSLLFFPRS